MTVSLASAAEVALGRQRAPQHEIGEHQVRYLRSANVGDGALDLSDVKSMNFTPSEQGVFGLRPGDVLLTEGSGSRETVGASAVWMGELDGPVCFQNTVLRLRPRQGKTLGRYLAWWARHAHASGMFAAVASGANILHLGAETLRSLQLHLPPLEEQRRIADFLDDQVTRIDAAIAARANQSDLVAERFRAWLDTQVILIARASVVAPLRHFVSGVEQGSSPLADSGAADSGEVGVLKTSSIKDGCFFEINNKCLIDRADYERRYRVSRGDVLVVRGSGSGDLVADVACVETEPYTTLMLSDLTYRLRAPRLDPMYLTLVLASPSCRGLVRAVIRQGSGPAKVRGEDLLALPVPVPPQVAQARLATTYREVRAEMLSTRDA